MAQTVTAAVLLIGNELLSGRTQDANLAFLGKALNGIGIQVREARVVSDVEAEIVAAVNELRAAHDYVFTTGGIGPTHDDITADSIAAAFGVGIGYHPAVYEELKSYFEGRGMEANEARMRMARIPDGASLIDNEVSLAPGFQIENVFVLAGVPQIAQAMFHGASARLRRGRSMLARTIRIHIGEGTVAESLAAVQAEFAEVEMGSYPWHENGRFGTSLVLRSFEADRLDAAFARLWAIVEELGGEPVEEAAAAD